MRRIYEPEGMLEAQLLVAMLASEGISAHLSGEHLLGAVGELPVQGLLGLQVADAQAERAQQLITAYNAAQPLPSDDVDDLAGVLIC